MYVKYSRVRRVSGLGGCFIIRARTFRFARERKLPKARWLLDWWFETKKAFIQGEDQRAASKNLPKITTCRSYGWYKGAGGLLNEIKCPDDKHSLARFTFYTFLSGRLTTNILAPILPRVALKFSRYAVIQPCSLNKRTFIYRLHIFPFPTVCFFFSGTFALNSNEM